MKINKWPPVFVKVLWWKVKDAPLWEQTWAWHEEMLRNGLDEIPNHCDEGGTECVPVKGTDMFSGKQRNNTWRGWCSVGSLTGALGRNLSLWNCALEGDCGTPVSFPSSLFSHRSLFLSSLTLPSPSHEMPSFVLLPVSSMMSHHKPKSHLKLSPDNPRLLTITNVLSW